MFGCWVFRRQYMTSWWLNQPNRKIISQNGNLPQSRGENKKYVKPPPRHIYTLKMLLFGKCHLSSFQKRCHTVSRWDVSEKKRQETEYCEKYIIASCTLLISHATRLKPTSYQHYPRFKHKLVGLALYHKPKQVGTRNDHSYTANMRFWHWKSSYHQVAILNFLDV